MQKAKSRARALTKKKSTKKPVRINREVKAKVEKVLVLRTCAHDMRAYGGFVWPRSGPVKCEEWRQKKICGWGLHGLLWGEGDGGYLDWSDTAVWMVVEVEKSKIVDINGKVKFPDCVVVFCGKREEAVAYLDAHGGDKYAGVLTTRTAGDGGTATAGYGGTATAGYGGTATAGTRGTATAGYGGTATAGDGGGIQIEFWDIRAGMWRRKMGVIGEDGLEANKKYRLNDEQKFIEVQ